WPLTAISWEFLLLTIANCVGKNADGMKKFISRQWMRQQIKRLLILYIHTGDIEHYKDIERIVAYGNGEI
ncbi:hypothetical protein QP139_10570, partial [Winkia sp. UMB10116]|uniref:hypothetical protein n=1 Tax=Winkia sp. UMB10116 TaxID=3046355 RepID=UPI002555B623